MKGNQKRFQEALKRIDKEVHTKASLGIYGNRPHAYSSQRVIDQKDSNKKTKNQNPNQSHAKPLIQTNKAFQRGRTSTDLGYTPKEPSYPTFKKTVGAPRSFRSKLPTIESATQEEINPKPPATPIDFNLHSARTRRKFSSGEEIQLYKSPNAKNIDALLRIPRDSPFTATPKEVGPILNWNDRKFLDYTTIEKELTRKTYQLHQLVTKDFETKTDDSQSLPIDFFDCYNNAPEEELKLRKIDENGCPVETDNSNEFTSHGSTQMRYDNEVEWDPCTVLNFDPNSFAFKVSLDNKFSAFDPTQPLIKDVSRFNLHFDGEDLDKLQERYNLAEQLRSEYEQNFRTITFLDEIQSTPQMANFIETDITSPLPDDAIIELLRAQKMQIIRGSLKLDSDSKLEKLMNDLNININAYTPNPSKEPFLINTSFGFSLNKIANSQSFISIPEFVKLRRGFHYACLNSFEKVKNLYETFFKNRLLTINEWRIKRMDLLEEIKAILFEFVDKLVLLINANVSNEILDDYNDDPELKAMKDIKDRPYFQFFIEGDTLFNHLKTALSFIIRQFSYDLLYENFLFFVDLINYEFPEIKFEEVSCDDFTIITNQSCEDSITCKKPIVMIDLQTDKSKAKQILIDLFNSINESLKEMINPFAVLFEKSDAKTVSTIEHSKFEPFLLTNGLTNFVPEIRHFNIESNEIGDYSNKLFGLFEISLDQHVKDSYKCYPEIQRQSNLVTMFFTKDQLPSDDEAYKVLTKLDEQRKFFLKNFPSYVNIGIYCVSMTSFIKNIDEGYALYRRNSCQNISNKLVQLMNELHRDYTALAGKLKQTVQTGENWITLQDTLDSVLTTRDKLDKTAEIIKFLYELLFSLFFGLESKILVRYLNTMMWPILIDMQLGQAVAQAMKAQKTYLQQNPIQIQQLQTEVDKLEESIKTENNADSRQKLKNYSNHLQERIVRISEINMRMKITKYDKFNTPRVRLWCLVTLCQASISEWTEIKINELDIDSIKNSIDEYLKELRSLTKSFRGDTNSLRLLISTKNDLEQVSPLFKACSQILALYPKEKTRIEISQLIGNPNYPNMTLSELKSSANISEMVPEIKAIYQRSKSEDKTDVDLINSEKTVQQIKVTFESNNSKILKNIDSLLITLRESKTILTNIYSIQDLPEPKKNASRKLILASRSMIEVLELFATIQSILEILSPLKKVSSIKDQAKIISDISKVYNDQIKILRKDPLLVNYASNQNNIKILKNIRTELKNVHRSIIEIVSKMRDKNARLILVPDSQIISVFANEINMKTKILSSIFYGVDNWIINDNSDLTAVTLDSGDTLVLVKPISMKEPIFSLIPNLEETFISSMKYAFFRDKEDHLESLPIQLCFLKIMQNPKLTVDPGKVSKLKFTALELFRKSVNESNKQIKVEIIEQQKSAPIENDKKNSEEEDNGNKNNEEEKNDKTEEEENGNEKTKKEENENQYNGMSNNSVYLVADKGRIEYGFRISKSHSNFFSPSLYEVIYDLISLHHSKSENVPLLVHSQSYSLSTIAIQQFSYLTGHPCFIIHPTITTPIYRIPEIVRRLNELRINVCIDEAEIFSTKQLFEISMLNKNKLYLSLTANSVSSIIQCGKIDYFLQAQLAQSHLEFIAPVFYPDQQKQIEFVTKTLTKYLHVEIAKNYIEQSYNQGKEMFDLNFVLNIRMIIPNEVFESALPDIMETASKKVQKNLNQLGQKVILSTQDFISGVELISEQFKFGNRIMMVAGPQFSGITTCIMAAAQSVNMQIISLAFSSPNWIRYIIEALENYDDKPLVLHILLPFDQLFSAHSSSLLLNGLICEGLNSLMTVSSKIFIVFEMMTSISNAITIPIPIFTFSTPLVKSSELLLYWLANSDFVMNYNDREFIRNIVAELIDNSHQLSIFYTLFSALLTAFPHFNKDSLSLMIGYCIYWSKVSQFTNIEEWNSYSDIVKNSIQQFEKYPLHIYQYMYNESSLENSSNDMFELDGVYKNTKCLSYDGSYLDKFSEVHCNLITNTNIPTQQFISCYQQLPLLIQNKKSVMIIGPQGSGKSTIAKYITMRFLREPYITLNFDGETATEEDLLNQLLSVSVITIDNIIQPKNNCICVIIVDLFTVDSKIYGSILSIAKTGNCIINKKLLLFKNFFFILVVEHYNYQLSTCCYPISIKPYTEEDFNYIAKEEITRILLKRAFSNPQITHLITSLQPSLPNIIQIINTDNKLRYLHFFFKLLRCVDNISSTQTINLTDFFRWKMLQLLSKSYGLNPLLVPPDATLIDYEFQAVNKDAKNKEKSAGISNKKSKKNEDNKDYVYAVLNKQQSQFEEAILPFSHLYLSNIDINRYSLEYLSFVFDVVFTSNTHAMVIDDLNQDYEMLTQFAASVLSAHFIVFHSPNQLASIIRESVLSPQPIILFCRKPNEELLSIISRGFKVTDVPKISNTINDNTVIEKLDIARNDSCTFPYANLGNQPTYIDHINKKLEKINNNIESIENENEENESLVVNKKSINSSNANEDLDNEQSFSPELSKTQAIVHRMRSSDFSFFQLHSFKTVHVFFNLTTVEEIADERKRNLFNLWDHSDKIPDTTKSSISIKTMKDKNKEQVKQNPLLQQLFSLMLRYKDKSLVKITHQLAKVIKRYNYIIDRVNKYIIQRRLFVQQILVVINAVEQSIKDTSELIISTKKQIEMDEAFLQTHIQAVEYRQTIVTDLSGELARNKAELDQINSKDAEYNAYKSRDSANTALLVEQATKLVVKAFSQEEQYKLYIQQNPSQAVRHLFNTYCILREFTPRDDNDYWPEARVLLKSGRFHRTITVFDKNNIKKSVILQFDVMMNNPLINEDNFPPNSACRALSQWIQAVHKHTQSTSFNTTVSQEMLELQKLKSRKEKEVEDIEKRLKAASEDLEKHEKSLNELKDKIQQENLLLANIVKYHETADQVSQCFGFVKEELNKFNEGEKSKGENMNGFAILEVCKSVVYPLFPKDFVPNIEKQVYELLNDNGVEYSYFVTLKEIIGNDEPVVLSILSGDRLIAVFDPNDTTYDLLSSDPTIPSLSKYDFLFTDPIESKTPAKTNNSSNVQNSMLQYYEQYGLANDGSETYDSDNKEYSFYSPGFIEDFISAAEKGKILVIHHADSVINNPFLNSISSQAVKSTIFKDRIVKINSDFRVIFLLDKPPSLYENSRSKLNLHVTFISCNEVVIEKLQSIILNDQSPMKMQQKKMNAELLLQAQKENLYLALQDCHSNLQQIHSSDTEVLKDISLQAQLLQNSKQALIDASFQSDHVIDGFAWVNTISLKITSFIEQMHLLYNTSPLYIFPLSKIEKSINCIQSKINLKSAKSESETNEKIEKFISSLFEITSISLLKNHLWNFEEMKSFANKKIDFNEINLPENKLFLLHYTDIALAAEFFIKNKFNYSSNNVDVNFSIDNATESDFIEKNVLPVLLQTDISSDVIITFFEENINVSNMIDKIIFDYPPSKWNPNTKLFIITDNSFEMPTHLVASFNLFALE